MNPTHEQLLAILQIGRDTSLTGMGISLRDALNRARYHDIRRLCSPEELIPILHANPHLVEDWIRFSEDKRTSGGWYVTRSAQVGRLKPAEEEEFRSMQEAVAHFVIRELDFWSGAA